MGKIIKINLPDNITPDEAYESGQDLGNITKTANAVISTVKIVGIIVVVAAIAIISTIAPMDIMIVASIILIIGYLALADDNYGPQGCLEAIWGVIKYAMLLSVLFLAFYVFMMIR